MGGGGGGGNHVGAFVGVREVLSIGRHFFNTRLVDMVANEWNVGLFAIWKVARCANCMDEYFLHLFCIWYYYNFHN